MSVNARCNNKHKAMLNKTYWWPMIQVSLGPPPQRRDVVMWISNNKELAPNSNHTQSQKMCSRFSMHPDSIEKGEEMFGNERVICLGT